MGNLYNSKVLTRITTIFKPDSMTNVLGVTTVETDQAQYQLEIPTPSYGYGYTPFGQGNAGTPCPQVVDINPIANTHTVAGQYFVGMKFNEVWLKLKLQGIELYVDTQKGPTSRGGQNHVK